MRRTIVVLALIAIMIIPPINLIDNAVKTAEAASSNYLEQTIFPGLSEYGVGGSWVEYKEYTSSSTVWDYVRTFRSVIVDDYGYTPVSSSLTYKFSIQRVSGTGTSYAKMVVRNDSAPGTWYDITPIFLTVSASWTIYTIDMQDFTTALTTNNIGPSFTIGVALRVDSGTVCGYRIYQAKVSLSYKHLGIDRIYTTSNNIYNSVNSYGTTINNRLGSYWNDFNNTRNSLTANLALKFSDLNASLLAYKVDVSDQITSLENNITNLLNGISDDMLTYYNDILDDMSDYFDDLEALINDLNGDISDLYSEVSDLRDDVDDSFADMTDKLDDIYGGLRTYIINSEFNITSNTTEVYDLVNVSKGEVIEFVNQTYDNINVSFDNMKYSFNVTISLIESLIKMYSESSRIDTQFTRATIVDTDAQYFTAEVVREKWWIWSEYSELSFFSTNGDKVKSFITYVNKSDKEYRYNPGSIFWGTDIVVVAYDGDETIVLRDNEVDFDDNNLTFTAGGDGYDKIEVHIAPGVYKRMLIWGDTWW